MNPRTIHEGSHYVFASPKSKTFTIPSRRRMMFSGLMSRCRMPAPCAAAMAEAVWIATSRTSLNFMGAVCIVLRRVSPSINSVAMKCRSAVCPISNASSNSLSICCHRSTAGSIVYAGVGEQQGKEDENEPQPPGHLNRPRSMLHNVSPSRQFSPCCPQFGERFILRSRSAYRGSERRGSNIGSNRNPGTTRFVSFSSKAFSSHLNACSFSPRPT